MFIFFALKTAQAYSCKDITVSETKNKARNANLLDLKKDQYCFINVGYITSSRFLGRT